MDGTGTDQPTSLLDNLITVALLFAQARVGEVGGNTLGLYGGVYSNDGERFVAHGYQGAFHIWKLDQVSQY